MITIKCRLLIKCTILIAINTLCIANTIGQQKYLAIYYFKYSGTRFPDNSQYVTLIPSLEGADFFVCFCRLPVAIKGLMCRNIIPAGKLNLLVKYCLTTRFL